MKSESQQDATEQNIGKVIVATSIGTIFEWYDFYLYGSWPYSLARYFSHPETIRLLFWLRLQPSARDLL
jgi:hypothetical protein